MHFKISQFVDVDQCRAMPCVYSGSAAVMLRGKLESVSFENITLLL